MLSNSFVRATVTTFSMAATSGQQRRLHSTSATPLATPTATPLMTPLATPMGTPQRPRAVFSSCRSVPLSPCLHFTTDCHNAAETPFLDLGVAGSTHAAAPTATASAMPKISATKALSHRIFDDDYDDRDAFVPLPSTESERFTKSVGDGVSRHIMRSHPNATTTTDPSPRIATSFADQSRTTANGYCFATAAEHRRAVTGGGSNSFAVRKPVVVGVAGLASATAASVTSSRRASSSSSASRSSSGVAVNLNPECETFSLDAAIESAIVTTRVEQLRRKERNRRRAAPPSLSKQMAIAAKAAAERQQHAAREAVKADERAVMAAQAVTEADRKLKFRQALQKAAL